MIAGAVLALALFADDGQITLLNADVRKARSRFNQR